MKEWMKPNKLEWISFFLVMPIVTFALNYFFFKELIWRDSRIALYSFPTIFLIGFCTWYLVVISMHLLRIFLPDVKQVILRTAFLTIAHISLMWLSVDTIFNLYTNVFIVPYAIDKSSYWPMIISCACVIFTTTPLWEVDYFLKKWKETIFEKEVMQQLAIKLEFELLKQQVDPHFLFNCFNTLSSLISGDIKQAQLFLKELRKVYQYLLDNKKEDFTTIENEVQFIRSYYTLLNTRFDNALQIDIAVEPQYLRFFIPSLSLQLLVENAVKHNIVSKRQKLYVTIANSDNNELIITNNLQRKSLRSKSFGIGMETILAKYRLLHQREMNVFEDGITYKVVLPLIQPEVIDQHNNALL